MEVNQGAEGQLMKISSSELLKMPTKKRNTSLDTKNRRKSSFFKSSAEDGNFKGAEGLFRNGRRLKSIQLFPYHQTNKDSIEPNEKEAPNSSHTAKRRESRLLNKKDKPTKISINSLLKPKAKLSGGSKMIYQQKKEFDEFRAEKFYESFDKHFIFSCIQPQQLRIIQSQFSCYEIKQGEFMFKKNDLANDCYLIERGFFKNDNPIVVKPEEAKKVIKPEKTSDTNFRPLRSPSKRIDSLGSLHFFESNTNTPEFTENISSFTNIQLEKNEKETTEEILGMNGAANLSNMDKEKVDIIMLRRCSISSKSISLEKDPSKPHKSSYSDSIEERIDEIPSLGVGSGQFLGDISLFLNCERLSDVKAAEDSILWGISRALFDKIIREGSYFHFTENIIFLQECLFFSLLPKSTIENIAAGMINMKFFRAESVSILNKKKLTQFLFIVREGLITLRRGKVSKPLRVGDYFYEECLLDVPVKYSVTINSDHAILLAIKPTVLRKYLSTEQLKAIYFYNQKQLLLKQSSLFRFVSDKFIERIAENMQVTRFEKGQTLSSERFRNRLMLLISGEIQTMDGKKFHRGPDILGKQSLCEKKFTSIQPEFISLKEGYFSDLTYEEFKLLVEKKSPSKLNNEVPPQKIKAIDLNQQDWSQSPIHLSSRKVDKSHIRLIKEIGEGKFGVVYLVSYENKLFALKIITKLNIIEFSAEKHLQNEKKILEYIEFPFFNRLFATFKDDHCIYFLLEYIKGCNLFNLICSSDGKLECDVVRFYAACIVLALQYLHQKGVIHRDLKPENIMVDDIGYPKIIDLGVAKNLHDETSLGSVFSLDSLGNEFVITDEFFNPKLRTFTLVGTPHYMAPEVIHGKGYNSSADYWSLGVILFEMMFGFLPFDTEEPSDNEASPYEVYKIILTRKLKIPKLKKELRARKFIKKLLKKNPQERIDSNEDLKQHKWFEKVVWEKILFREFKAPLVPIIEEADNEEAMDITLDHLINSHEMKEFRKYSLENRDNEISGWDDVF